MFRFRCCGGLAFLGVVLAPAAALAQTQTQPIYHLLTMHTHPWFWDVMGASVVGWVIGIVKGFSGAKEWLERYWPNPPHSVVWLLDLVIFVVVGAYFGTGIYNPTNFLAAVAAGLSWPIGLGALATKD